MVVGVFVIGGIVGVMILGLSFLLVKENQGTRRSSKPHGSMGLPLFGETLSFLKPHTSNSLGSFLQRHITRYGRVFRSHLFGYPTLVSCDYEFNMFILQNEEKLYEASYPKSLSGVLGDLSLLIATGETHKRLRNIVVQFISASKSKPEFLQDVEATCISTIELWKQQKQISFLRETKKITFNLTIRQLLSIKPEDPIGAEILHDFETYMNGFVSFPINIPGTAFSKAVKARARLSSTMKDIIKQRRKMIFANMNAKGDFLDVMLSNWSLSDKEIVSVCLDILLGGYETTAKLMSLIVYFLSHSPPDFQTFKEEHKAIRENKDLYKPLNLDDYDKMAFTHMVTNEAMRCGNVVKLLHRKAIKDVKYKDYVIPCGWKVLPILSGPHFDPMLHKNPFNFNPARWNDEGTSKKVMPFGGGLRHCPGAHLAKLEIAFFLHHLVLNLKWKLQEDDIPMAYPFVEFTNGLVLEFE